MLVAIDSSDTDFDGAEETGGSKTHTLTENQLPSHRHQVGSHDSTQDLVVRRNVEFVQDGTGIGNAVNTSFTSDERDKHILSFSIYCCLYVQKRTA